MQAHKPIPIEAIHAARSRIAGSAIRTPLVRLNVDDAPAEIYLKLENLQPIGSFKLRGASNAMALATREQLSNGVYTSSAGNMAQGVAWSARRMGISATIVVPDNAPETKLAAIERLGAQLVRVPYDEWWHVMTTHHYEPLAGGLFIHPSSNPAVMAGNGTIGLEILEDLPDVDADPDSLWQRRNEFWNRLCSPCSQTRDQNLCLRGGNGSACSRVAGGGFSSGY